MPWWGADLQTLRDGVRPEVFPSDHGVPVSIRVGEPDRLLARLDRPRNQPPRALVLLVHGPGGSSQSQGIRRLGLRLQAHGFAVLRLNLRGAGLGRSLAAGSYAAECNRDLLPVLAHARGLAAELAGPRRSLPLFGVGISLGGTVLLNAQFRCRFPAGEALEAPSSLPDAALEGLVCLSSPLDLAACSAWMERPRNSAYLRWLLQRLCSEICRDPFGIPDRERHLLSGSQRPRSLRAFDAAITAPRWAHDSLAAYHAAASPLARLVAACGEAVATRSCPVLLVHARDDPWVPVEPLLGLQRLLDAGRSKRLGWEPGGFVPDVVLSETGGHNGFHGPGGCWSDALTVAWLERLLQGRGESPVLAEPWGPGGAQEASSVSIGSSTIGRDQ